MKRSQETSGRRQYLLSLAIQIAIAPFVVHDWDGFVFTRAVRDLLAGLTPYAVVEADPSYIHLGTSWPPLNTWYAYPPLPLLSLTPSVALALACGGAPWLMRLALKLPCIAGTLVLAWSGERLLRSMGKADGVARWRKLILFNPFLLFVSAAWGMFDAWMVAFLLLTLVLIDRNRPRAAGIAFGAATLVKLFPLFAAPALLLHVWRRSHRRSDAIGFVGSSVATFAAVSLPFFAAHPRGFVLQVLSMHLQRPAQGLSIVAVLSEIGRLAAAEGWLARAPAFALVTTLTLGIGIAMVIATTAATARARTSLAFASSLLGLFLGVLFTSKVLNEQYFVIPVALHALLLCGGLPRASFGYRAFTIGAFIASVVLGWHFLTFWPAEVADTLFGRRSYMIVGAMAAWVGLSSAAFAFVPTSISFLSLAPAFARGTALVARECRAGVRVLSVLLRAVRIRLRPRLVLALLFATPIVVQAATFRGTSQSLPPIDSNHRHVGAFYYLWWANPSHDPSVRDGNWAGIAETPTDGNYTITASKLKKDFAAARANGIDLIVTSFHEYDVPLIPAASNAAYAVDLAIAPLVEIGDVYARPEFGVKNGGFALRDATATAIVELISKALAAFADSPAAYRPNGRLAAFLYDSYDSEADWAPAFVDRLADHAASIAERDVSTDGAAPIARADLEATKPGSYDDLFGSGVHAHLWRRAYTEIYHAFWTDIRRRLEARFGPLFLAGGETWNPGAPFHHSAETGLQGTRIYDANFIYSPSFVWVLHRGDSYERNWERWVVRNVLQAQYTRAANQLLISTVNPTYDDRVLRKKKGFTIPVNGPYGSTYDATWTFALDLSPDLVLVSTWNEFYEGSAIEPTVEHGDSFLKATLDWSREAQKPRQKRRRGLVVTGEGSAHFAPGITDPHVDGRYARNMQVVAERDLPDFTFDAADVTDGFEQVALEPYELILVEPGLDMRTKSIEESADRLEAWVRSGGRLLLSNPSPGSAWERLAGMTAHDVEQPTRVTTTDGVELVLPPASHPRVGDAEADVVLRYADGNVRGRTAAWVRRVGVGRMVVSSMNVTGRDAYPGPDATAVFCACTRPLLPDGVRCAHTNPSVIP